MDPFASKKPAKSQQNHSVNPFAKALQETESSFSGGDQQNTESNPFSDALARTGGQMGEYPAADNQPSGPDLEAQQRDMERKQKREALRKKLHDQVNPVNTKDVFDARAKQVKEELEKTRRELHMLAKEIAALRIDVDIETMKEVAQPGQTGTYYVNFFQQLRKFIQLLTKQVRSARTWMQQSQAKSQKKKKGSKKPGLEIGGGKSEKTKTVFDTMNNERGTAYSGN
jgi:hypothetical protein